MENNANIKIKTYQEINGEEDVIELETGGKFGMRGGKYYIIYEESELTGFMGSTTTIKISENVVSVRRRGTVTSNMEYSTDDTRLCLMKTPFGEIAAAVTTDMIDYAFDENGGYLKVNYLLDADNTNFMRNSLNITVTVQ